MKKFFVLLVLFHSISFAQVTWLPTYNLSNTPSATSDYHSVYSDIFGNYYVAWQDNGEIKYKYSSDRGETWSNNVTVFSSSSIAGYPVITAESGSVNIAFHQNPGDYEVIYISSTDYGATWTNTIGVSGMDSGSQTPQMTSFAGHIYIIWEQKPDLFNNIMEIYFIKSTDGGQTWSSPANISNTPTSSSRWAQIKCIGNTIYCAWLESVTYPLSDIYFSKSTDTGNTWSTPTNITNNTRAQNRIFMDVSYDQNGPIIYIASDDIITFNFDEIFLMKSTDGGSTWSTPFNITNNSGHSSTPCLYTTGDFLLFTWSDNTHSAPAYDNSDIFFKWSSDAGITWQDSINISANSDISSRPRFCFSIDGPIGSPWSDFTVVWYDYSLGDSEILARRGKQFFTPVELLSFSSYVFNNDVTLNWTTATETNNSGFQIERRETKNEKSEDWENIGFVDGNGTTTETKSYSYKDEKLSSGKYQYRLKQIDFDGTFEYSNIIEAEILPPAKFSLEQNYPNPFNPSTSIQYSLANKQFVSLKIFDLLGREIVALVNEEQPAGNYTIEFKPESSIKTLVSGVYLYQLKAGEFIQARKMILLK